MSAILFPHTSLPGEILKKLCEFFRPITICQPWFMTPPVSSDEDIEAGSIRIVNPPDSMKPENAFDNLLMDYQRWADLNSGRHYADIVRMDRPDDPGEDSTWGIRQMLGRMIRPDAPVEKNNILKYHLILHMAREIEIQRYEADKIRRELSRKRALLEGSIEKADNIDNLLGDLPGFDLKSGLDESNLKRITEAWCALFVGQLTQGGILVTTSLDVLDYICEAWEKMNPEKDNVDNSMIRFDIPCVGQDRYGEIGELLVSFGDDPDKKIAALEELAGEFRPSEGKETSGRIIGITVKHLNPPAGEEAFKKDAFLNTLQRKIIVLVQGLCSEE